MFRVVISVMVVLNAHNDRRCDVATVDLSHESFINRQETNGIELHPSKVYQYQGVLAEQLEHAGTIGVAG